VTDTLLVAVVVRDDPIPPGLGAIADPADIGLAGTAPDLARRNS